MGLYRGHASADSTSVECFTCGLRMVVRLPDEWPRGVKRTIPAIEAHCLAEAIKRWNRRTRS